LAQILSANTAPARAGARGPLAKRVTWRTPLVEPSIRNGLRAERQKKSMEERETHNKEYDLVHRQRAADKLDEQPHVAEMTLIEQTMAFCKSLQGSKDTAVTEEKKEAKAKDKANA